MCVRVRVCVCVHISVHIPALHISGSYKSKVNILNDYLPTHTDSKKCCSQCTFHMSLCSQFVATEEVSDMNTMSTFQFACEF
jgi:hypothetical protein